MKTKHIAYLAIIVFSIGCKGNTVDPVAPTAIELKLAALQNESKPWSISSGSVTKDGFDVSSQFDGFSLTFGEFTTPLKMDLIALGQVQAPGNLAMITQTKYSEMMEY